MNKLYSSNHLATNLHIHIIIVIIVIIIVVIVVIIVIIVVDIVDHLHRNSEEGFDKCQERKYCKRFWTTR